MALLQLLICIPLMISGRIVFAKPDVTIEMNVNWDNTIAISKTYPTLQVVVNPLLTRKSLIYDQAYKSLSNLNANFVRFVPFFPYPRLGVAQLEPPSGKHYCKHLNGDSNHNNWTVHLQCPIVNANKNNYINKIDFVSWGNPTGSCGNFSIGSCNSPNAQSIVNNLCVQKTNCTIAVNTDTFKGDPCKGVQKAFAIQITCDIPYNYSNWDFDALDELMQDFFHAVNPNNEHNKTVLDFSTMPNWFYQGVTYGEGYTDNPYDTSWQNTDNSYNIGTKLIDPTATAFGEYYGRIVSWYKNGYFIDEYGTKYESNRNKNYTIDIWEILNEPQAKNEHANTPQSYTQIYDATIEGIWKHADPSKEIKFMGISLGPDYSNYDWFTYFLNSSHHKPGIPIDYISFHFYGNSKNRTDPNSYCNFFVQVDKFVSDVQDIIHIRDTLSPHTKLDINELGTILSNDNSIPSPPDPPQIYWNAGGAMYAYAVARLSVLQVDIIGLSQLLGFPQLTQKQFPASPGGIPPQWPSVSILDWNNGIGNAKYWCLYLLLRHLSVDDALVETNISSDDSKYFFAQGYVRYNDSTNYILVINKMNENITVEMDDLTGGDMYIVDENTAEKPARNQQFEGTQFVLQRFAVAVLYPLV